MGHFQGEIWTCLEINLEAVRQVGKPFPLSGESRRLSFG